jgi:hypothetical protein
MNPADFQLILVSFLQKGSLQKGKRLPHTVTISMQQRLLRDNPERLTRSRSLLKMASFKNTKKKLIFSAFGKGNEREWSHVLQCVHFVS